VEEFAEGRYGSAIDGFEEAYALDTTYLRALVLAAGTCSFAGELAREDSLLNIILPRRLDLAPYDRLRVDLLQAGLAGDNLAALAHAREAAELVPFGTARWALINSLIRAERPLESLQTLEPYLDELVATIGQWFGLWDTYAQVLHLLGDHERELEVSLQGREAVPSSLNPLVFQGRALAALGRVEETLQLGREIIESDLPSQRVPGALLLVVSAELRAHGHVDAAATLLDEALAWFDEQPLEWRSTTAGRALQGQLLYARGRWAESDAVFASLADKPSIALTYLAYRGVIAARRGEREAANGFSTRLANLDQPFLRGRNTKLRADIAALLGEPEQAMALLRRAMREGVGWGMWLHTDMDLEPLRDHPQFVELKRPKG
jgi:tetratricopeptide (TPR) repeat protein